MNQLDNLGMVDRYRLQQMNIHEIEVTEDHLSMPRPDAYRDIMDALSEQVQPPLVREDPRLTLISICVGRAIQIAHTYTGNVPSDRGVATPRYFVSS